MSQKWFRATTRYREYNRIKSIEKKEGESNSFARDDKSIERIKNVATSLKEFFDSPDGIDAFDLLRESKYLIRIAYGYEPPKSGICWHFYLNRFGFYKSRPTENFPGFSQTICFDEIEPLSYEDALRMAWFHYRIIPEMFIKFLRIELNKIAQNAPKIKK